MVPTMGGLERGLQVVARLFYLAEILTMGPPPLLKIPVSAPGESNMRHCLFILRWFGTDLVKL